MLVYQRVVFPYTCMCTNVHIDLSNSTGITQSLGNISNPSTRRDEMPPGRASATISHHGIIVVKHLVHHSKRVACALLATLKNKKNLWMGYREKPFLNQLFWMAKAQSKIMGCLPSINWFILEITVC